MGWSCRADAGRTLDKWSEACRESTGRSNVWKDGASWYMYELSNREHADGAITGTILRFLDSPMTDGPARCKPAGSFRIDPDGTVKRASAWLKAAAA